MWTSLIFNAQDDGMNYSHLIEVIPRPYAGYSRRERPMAIDLDTVESLRLVFAHATHGGTHTCCRVSALPAHFERGDVSTNGRACRASCPSQSCHAFHGPLHMDVRSRSGARTGLIQLPDRIGSGVSRQCVHRPAAGRTSLGCPSDSRPSLFPALNDPFHTNGDSQ